MRDGRWLRDGANATSAGSVMDSYALWWASGLSGVRQNYYNWLATALWARLSVAGRARFLPRLAAHVPALTSLLAATLDGSLPGGDCSKWDPINDGIYSWMGCAGQEHNLAGGGLQPLVHAMMVSEAGSMAALCGIAGNATCAMQFGALRDAFQARLLRLWNANISSFDTLNSSLAPRGSPWAGVRTLSSLSSPWYFNAVPPEQATRYGASWDTAWDSAGLGGAHGLRTAEARNPAYSCHPKSCCYWGGPVWPFESCKAITGAANVLQSATLAAAAPSVTRSRVWKLLTDYTAMHGPAWTITNFSTGARANYSLLNASGYFLSGLGVDWIAEAGCAEDATWTDNPSGGFWYEHSTYMDLIIQLVAGLQPFAAADAPHVLVQPLQPGDDALAWWCLDGVLVNGHILTIFWDADGSRYGRGAGLRVLVDGAEAASAATTQGPSLNVSVV